MEINVGDYVRIIDDLGKQFIGKVYNINDFREPSMKYAVDCQIFNDYAFVGEERIVKSSPNIIDLIEENDLIKIEFYSPRYEKRVIRLFEVDYIVDKSICFENGHCQLNILDGEWSNQDKELNPIIKSIVTKEQFEQMQYKVGE